MSGHYRDWYDALMAEKAEAMRKADRRLIARSEEWDEHCFLASIHCPPATIAQMEAFLFALSFVTDPEFRAAGERGRR